MLLRRLGTARLSDRAQDWEEAVYTSCGLALPAGLEKPKNDAGVQAIPPARVTKGGSSEPPFSFVVAL